jgi:putative endonuclease
VLFYIYILYSPSSDIYYVGYSEDVPRRLEQHNNPLRSKFTSKHIPWVLKIHFEVADTRSGAVIAEKHIKRQKSRKYIELLISNETERLKLKDKVMGTGSSVG